MLDTLRLRKSKNLDCTVIKLDRKRIEKKKSKIEFMRKEINCKLIVNYYFNLVYQIFW